MFTPKKIGAGAGRAAQYYTEEFHKEDYYAKGKEPPGRWVGGRSLGLDGEVRAEDLRALFEGKNPAEKELVQGAGEAHAPGWDMVFSAPKSVSVLWGTADASIRKTIEDAHEKAVKEALAFLEEHSLADACRRRKGGVHRESPSELLVATFQHGTSREHDPQLHTHALLLNVARRKDGSWGALQPDGIYRDAKLVGALYRAELASELGRELGIAFERNGDSLRIAGMDERVERAFSKRRQAIEAALAESGFSGAKSAATAAVNTRSRKQEKDREELFAEWKEQAGALSFVPEKVLAVARDARVKREKETSRSREWNPHGAHEERIAQSLSLLSEIRSTFTRHRLYERIALEGQERSSAKELRETFVLVHSARELVSLEGTNGRGEDLYTTISLRLLEEQLVARGKEMAARTHEVAGLAINVSPDLQGKMASLSREQRDVVAHVTQGCALTLVQGWAGAGKSTTMAAAREVFEAQGAHVVGVAPTGKAAENLTQGSQIPAQTIDAFLLSKGAALAGQGLGVLVVDEAAMVGSRKMEALLRVAQERDARVVLVGDSRQLAPIDAGAPFRVLEREIGSRSLQEIRRQEILWQREAVKAFAEGRALEGLQAYREAGLLITSETGRARDEELIVSWRKATVEQGAQALILATTNAHVKSLNEAARAEWRKAGFVRGKEHTFEVRLRDGSQEERAFQKGDRVVFTKNDREIGVKNGQFGTVEQIVDRGQKSGAQVKVTIDDGRDVSFNVGTYAHIEHGYASTVYKAQGSTIERVFVAHTPGMGREAAYVAMSRHRVGVELHVARDAFEAKDWGTLHETPVRAADKQVALQAQLDRIVAQAAKEMERAQEKAMSVEYGVKKAIVHDAHRSQEQENENEQRTSPREAPSKEQTRSRGRGRSFGW
jgi:Ti-type conjugative transfer relaxase TraA